jgi:hypothetical protein
LLGGLTAGCDWRSQGKLLTHGILKPPFSESALVEMKPMLLWSDNHARTHESHESDDLVCGKPISVNQVSTDEAAGATQTSLAVDSNSPFFHGNHFVGHFDESSNQW